MHPFEGPLRLTIAVNVQNIGITVETTMEFNTDYSTVP